MATAGGECTGFDNLPLQGCHDGEMTTREMNFDPFDLPAMHIFRIRDSRIHEIEAMGVLRRFMSTNGWTEFLN